MSADNWRHCPRCWATDIAHREAEATAVQESYGRVSAQEYLNRLRALYALPRLDAAEPTFREDYEIGVSVEGEFYVHYKGFCKMCGLDWKFRHTNKLDLK